MENKIIKIEENQIIEINGVQINTEFLKAVKNFQEQHQTRLLKGKIPDPFFSMFHPAPNKGPSEINKTLLLIGNNIEYLERLLLDHEICRDGFAAFISIKDEFLSLSADYREAINIDNYIEEVRPGMMKHIESFDLDIANLKMEIESEKANPSNISMAIRLHSRLGHL